MGNDLISLCAAKLPAADVLTIEEIVTLLPELDELIAWAKGVQEHALTLALQGEKIPGFKIVEGRTTRKYSDADGAVAKCIELGIPEAMLYKPKEAISVSDMEKMLGKARFAANIAPFFVERGVGKPTLVVESDKRPEFNYASATDDFKELLK